MLKIGLTGNIGSGKTICSKLFSMLNVPIYNADIEAKKLYFDTNIKSKVIELFGNEILTNEEIDKEKLSEIIFNDQKALSALNNIIHPRVLADFNKWINSQTKELPYVILESAILFENGLNVFFDKIIVVTSPVENRIERVMSRDHLSKEEVLTRIYNQFSDETKINQANFIIHNTDKELVLPQVLSIHSNLIIIKKPGFTRP